MSRYVRRIEAQELWNRRRSLDELSTMIEDPPLWVIRDFMPSLRDKDGLSVFEISDDNDEEVDLIEAAWRLALEEKLESKFSVFAVIGSDRLAGTGLNVRSSEGSLNHKIVDLMHREIVIADFESVRLAASAFLSGTVIAVEGKTVKASVRKTVQDNQFDFKACFKKRGFNIHPVKHLAGFVSDGIVSVRGLDTALPSTSDKPSPINGAS